MSKLQNFVDAKLENPELVEGARGNRREGPHSPFNDNPYYTPKFHDAGREGNRIAKKAERRRDHALAKVERQRNRAERRAGRNKH